MIPVLREIVELMISKKYIKLLFATESFAIGLDCPIKTAVFTGLTKFDGSQERLLHSHEYTQMAGRAGRRGIDTIGHVVHLNNLFHFPNMNDYKSLLSGKPQKLVSKFHISYSTILSLLQKHKQVDTKIFLEFANKSMVQNEIIQSGSQTKKESEEIQQKIEKKRELMKCMRTPSDICRNYLELQENKKTAVNKKKKEIERRISFLEDEYKYIKTDSFPFVEMTQLENEWMKTIKQFEYTEKYLEMEIEGVCSILWKHGFLSRMEDEKYALTDLGTVASNIAEIHPLILPKLMYSKWDHFSGFSSKQLVGLFSCMTDIKIPSDLRSLLPSIEDRYLRERLVEMKDVYNLFENEETEKIIHTGILYTDCLTFDIIDETMEWCECDTEEKCRLFLQNRIAEKSISVGDFTKSLLKIVVITKEMMNISENHVDLLYKLNQIEPMILKYITTNQSLYI